MSVRTDVVNLVVNVNGNQAQNNLNNLRKKAADITSEMQNLVKGTQAYIDKNKELKQVTGEMDNLKKQMGIATLSQKELNAELRKLSAIKGSLQPFTAEFNNIEKQIVAVKTRLSEVKNGVEGFGSTFSKIGDEVKKFGAIATAYLGFQFLTSQLQNIVKGSGKLSDQLADLQRVAGLTAGEAENLNTQLKNIDTRTSAEGLREIAIVSGKLGVAKDDIFDFTKAVDQLVVTLGDELGNADQITTQLGKILNVFDGKINGDNISKLGNVFVELANTGSATGGFIAEFDQRLSSIAKSSGISLGALSGLGAGIEELGGKVESSTSGVQNLLIKIAGDLPAAAKIAGKSTEEFTKLFNINPTEALLQYSEGLTKNKQNFADVTASLKDAGEEGVRTVSTITLLGKNADILRGRIALGTQVLKDNSAITEAFNLKNQTLGATLEKIGNSFNNIFSNSVITKFLKGVADGFLNIISPAQTATDIYKKQASEVKHLTDSTIPLLDRISDLYQKTNRSNAESAEMNKAIQSVASTIPSAVLQFDKYGNAIAISSTKAREFIALQQLILKEKNRDAIADQNKTIAGLEAQLPGYVGQLANSQREVKKLYEVAEKLQKTGIVPTNTLKEIEFYNNGIAILTNKITGLQDRIKGSKGLVDELSGKQQTVSTKPDKVGDNGSEEEKLKKAAEAAALKKQAEEAAAARKKQDAEDEIERKAKYKKIQEDFEKFQLELADIKRKSDQEGYDPQQKEIVLIQEKYTELLKRANDYYNALNAIDKAANKEKLTTEQQLIEDAYQQEIAASTKKFLALKATEEAGRNDRNYKSAQSSQKDIEDQNRLQLKQQYAAGTIDKKEYEAELVKLAKSARENEISTAELWAKKSKQAAKDVVDFKKLQEIELTDAQILENEKRAEIEAKIKDDRIQAAKDRIDEVISYAQAIGDIFTGINQLMAAKENALLQKDKAANEAKKKLYKDQLDQRLISKGQYDKKVEDADLEMDRKERALKRKQAERDKALNIFQAIINTASAVTALLATPPLAIMAGILGAIEIATISAQPLPELGKGDWIRTGDKHSDQSGGIPAMIERDEAVMSAAAMRNSERFTISGSTAQITSALNSRVGGAAWAGGASILPLWATSMPARINPGLPQIMEQGGIVRPINNDNVPGIENSALLLNRVINLLEESNIITKQKHDRLHAVVSIKEIDQQRALYDAAKKASF